MKFDESTVCHYLYGYQPMRLATVEEINKEMKQKDGTRTKIIKLEDDDESTKPVNHQYKIRLADGIALCVSSIPGAKYGACAIQNIPAGTWFGPFEGKLVRTNDDFEGLHSEYMWEIFHDGKVSHFLDGRNQNSWMSFVKCARYKKEQNMVVFQYHGCIYYRTTEEIHACSELLVWYDSKYTQLLGLPLTWNETKNSSGKRKVTGKFTNDSSRKKRCQRQKSTEDKWPIKSQFEMSINLNANMASKGSYEGHHQGNGEHHQGSLNMCREICFSGEKHGEINNRTQINHIVKDNHICSRMSNNRIHDDHKCIEERMMHHGMLVGRNWSPMRKTEDSNYAPSHFPYHEDFASKMKYNLHHVCQQMQGKHTASDLNCTMPYMHYPYIDSEHRSLQFS